MGLFKPLAITLTGFPHLKISFYLISLSGVTALYLLYPGNYKRFDRNVLRPIRNYRANLRDYNRFQLQEEFTEFISEVGRGVAMTIAGK